MRKMRLTHGWHKLWELLPSWYKYIAGGLMCLASGWLALGFLLSAGRCFFAFGKC